MKNKSIESLVNENLTYAKILDLFGFKVSESGEKTLGEICKENGLDEDRLIEILEKSERRSEEYLDLRNYPVRMIVEYLKHAHQIFVKDTLPYILRKVDQLEQGEPREMIEDLKVVLPMFVEDFIHHIYEEEDRLFRYVCELEKLVIKNKVTFVSLPDFDKFSIQEFALHHNDSDHEMRGIRGITHNYRTEDIHDKELKLLLKFLEQFDQDLTTHAHIENDILFPRALMLEKKAKAMLIKNAGLN